MDVQETTFSKKLNDSRLYITQHSNLEEMLLMITTSTISGMFGTKTEKKNCMNDTLKILNFKKSEQEKGDTNVEEPESVKKLKEDAMTICSNYNIYMRNLCKESCKFILDNHNSLSQLIEKSKEELQSLQQIKEKYRGINNKIVDDAYNEKVLSLMKQFEEDVDFIKQKKHEISVDRTEITEEMKTFQSNIFSLYKNVPLEALINVKNSYEYDFYEIEKNVCQLFEEYLVKWSKSLLF
tara:strand:+ start:1444 stop:2157 length:714 start_codon:yes stop_codon:yes gene_type:complete